MWKLIALVSLLKFIACFKFVPNDNSDPWTPPALCTSHSGLCHLAYRYVDENGTPLYTLGHASPLCHCPAPNNCSTDWTDTKNAVIKTLFSGAGQELQVRTSYCQLPTHTTRCGFNQPALVTRGKGPMTFELETESPCKCTRALHAHRSWTNDGYDYIEYSCGKPRCAKISASSCAKLTYEDDENIRHEYICRCRRRETCEGEIPVTVNQTTLHSCQKNEDPTFTAL